MAPLDKPVEVFLDRVAVGDISIAQRRYVQLPAPFLSRVLPRLVFVRGQGRLHEEARGPFRRLPSRKGCNRRIVAAGMRVSHVTPHTPGWYPLHSQQPPPTSCLHFFLV